MFAACWANAEMLSAERWAVRKRKKGGSAAFKESAVAMRWEVSPCFFREVVCKLQYLCRQFAEG